MEWAEEMFSCDIGEGSWVTYVKLVGERSQSLNIFYFLSTHLCYQGSG